MTFPGGVSWFDGYLVERQGRESMWSPLEDSLGFQPGVICPLSLSGDIWQGLQTSLVVITGGEGDVIAN